MDSKRILIFLILFNGTLNLIHIVIAANNINNQLLNNKCNNTYVDDFNSLLIVNNNNNSNQSLLDKYQKCIINIKLNDINTNFLLKFTLNYSKCVNNKINLILNSNNNEILNKNLCELFNISMNYVLINAINSLSLNLFDINNNTNLFDIINNITVTKFYYGDNSTGMFLRIYKLIKHFIVQN